MNKETLQCSLRLSSRLSFCLESFGSALEVCSTLCSQHCTWQGFCLVVYKSLISSQIPILVDICSLTNCDDLQLALYSIDCSGCLKAPNQSCQQAGFDLKALIGCLLASSDFCLKPVATAFDFFLIFFYSLLAHCSCLGVGSGAGL